MPSNGRGDTSDDPITRRVIAGSSLDDMAKTSDSAKIPPLSAKRNFPQPTKFPRGCLCSGPVIHGWSDGHSHREYNLELGWRSLRAQQGSVVGCQNQSQLTTAIARMYRSGTPCSRIVTDHLQEGPIPVCCGTDQLLKVVAVRSIVMTRRLDNDLLLVDPTVEQGNFLGDRNLLVLALVDGSHEV